MKHLTSTIKQAYRDGLILYGECRHLPLWESMSNDPRMCVFEFASTCLCVCMLLPMCPWGMNGDMHLLMFMCTQTHTIPLFLSVFACAQSAERWGLSWCRGSCNE